MLKMELLKKRTVCLVKRLFINNKKSEDLISIGTGMAYGYFFYLKDAVFIRSNNEDDLKTRIETFEANNHVKMTAKKILILVPILRSSDLGSAWSKVNDVKMNVAGTKNREYMLPVYKLEDDRGDKYFLMDNAQCLDVLPKILIKGKPLLKNQMQKMTDQFLQVLKSLLDNDESCRGLYKLIKFNENDDINNVVLKNYDKRDVLNTTSLDSLSLTNLGKGLAYWYFFNYLHIIAPKMLASIEKWQNNEKYQLISKKLYIMVPNTCYCPPDVIDLNDPYIEYAKDLENNPDKVPVNVNGRVYKTSVIRIKIDSDKDPTFCLAEFATPIRQLYCMVKEGFVAKNEKDHHRGDFIMCLKQLLKTEFSQDDNQKIRFSDLFEVIPINDIGSNGGKKFSEILLDKIKSSCRRSNL